MHQQIRSEPRLSPPDVGQFLEKLAKAGVNIVAVGGGSIEHGGKVAVACHAGGEGGRDDLEKAKAALGKYKYEIVEEGMNDSGYLHVGAMRDKEGELAREIRAAIKSAGTGYIVEDVALGVPYKEDGELVFPVQVFCVKSDGEPPRRAARPQATSGG